MLLTLHSHCSLPQFRPVVDACGLHKRLALTCRPAASQQCRRRSHPMPSCASGSSTAPPPPPDDSTSSSGSSGGGFNPFKNKKEDAAKRALQDMFKDKKDILAAYDSTGGGDGGSGDGGGGGGWSWGGFNWRDWGDRFGKGFRGLLSTFGAIALFATALFAVTLWQPVLGTFINLLRWVLRLDGGSRQRGPAHSHAVPEVEGVSDIGAMEQSVLSKFGGDDDMEEDDDDAEGD